MHSRVRRNAAGSGSIAVTVSREKRTPGFAKSCNGAGRPRAVSPEHEIELRVPEDECVVRIDERRDAGVLTELGRKHRR